MKLEVLSAPEQQDREFLPLHEKAKRFGKGVLYVLRTGDVGIRLKRNTEEE
jgi:hypothetical protein